MLGDLSNIEDKDSILLIQDSKENPYFSISKIINGYDKFIKLLRLTEKKQNINLRNINIEVVGNLDFSI